MFSPEWTSHDLNDYINSLSDEERESVLESILVKHKLKEFLQTPEGRLVFEDLVGMIKGRISMILFKAMDSVGTHREEIAEAARELNVALRIMGRFQSIMAKAENHESRLKVIRGDKK